MEGLDIIQYHGEGYKAMLYYDSWRVAFLRYAERFDKEHIQKLERHLLTDEVFVLLKGKEDVFSSLLSRAAFVFSNRLHAAVAALALGVPCVLFPQSAKATAFAEDVKEEAERLGVPAPCRLLPFSFEPFYDFSPKEEEILQVKNSLLNRFIPFSPTK